MQKTQKKNDLIKKNIYSSCYNLLINKCEKIDI